MTKRLFGEILAGDFGIAPGEIDKALTFQEEYGGRLGEILVNSGIISEEQVTATLARQFGLKELKELLNGFPGQEMDFEPLMGIQPVWFITNEIIPLFSRENFAYFAMRDPLNLFPIEVLKKVCHTVSPCFVPADERMYRELIHGFNGKYFQQDDSQYDRNEVEKLRDLAAEAPIIKFVNAMISRAAENRASDIHLESHDNYLKIRYRIDGVLKDVDRALADTASAVISRVKIMAELDIGEKRLPQDGRIRTRVAGKLFDIRVSTLPTIYGENIVMRLLEKENITYDIDTLGLMEPDTQKIQRLISHNFGLILVTGPTGSGKSTTLYSILNGLNREESKIITVEDPVEYQLEGISQIQVHEQIGLSFVSVLRNILRQDPDIVMIGEIRDKETAEIAVRASLTGHLVLATLHTNDAVSAVTRLVDMGVEDYLVNSSLLGVVAQRLVRKICPHCSRTGEADRSVAEQLNAMEIQRRHGIAEPVFKKGTGCQECAGTGYKGRQGVFEILEFTDFIKSAFLQNKEYEYLKNLLKEKGFKTLREDAILKWLRGETTAEEVFRVT